MRRQIVWTAIVTAVSTAALLVFTFTVLFPGEGIGLHGWIAAGIGIVLSTLLGVGLMFLVFLSSRGGYDDAVHHEDETQGLPRR